MAYVKQTWTDGDTIEATGLNHIEDGIENCSNIVYFETTCTWNDQEGTEVPDWSPSVAPQRNILIPNKVNNTRKINRSRNLDSNSNDQYPHFTPINYNAFVQAYNAGKYIFIFVNDQGSNYRYLPRHKNIMEFDGFGCDSQGQVVLDVYSFYYLSYLEVFLYPDGTLTSLSPASIEQGGDS